MTFPIIESVTPSNQDGDSTSFVMNMPATCPDGDLYIAWVVKDDDDAFTSVPGNWNQIDLGVSSTQIRCGLYYWFGNNEPASYTVQGDSEEWAGAIIRISGADTTTPINKIGIATTGTDATAEIPQVTPDVDNPLLLAFAGIDTDFWNTTNQYPSDWDGLFTQNSGTSETGSANAIGASKEGQNGVASGSGTFTANGSDEWRAITIAIAPVAGEEYQKELTETISLSDFIAKYILKPYTESLFLADTIAKSMSQIYIENLVFSDMIGFDKIKLSEILNLSDNFSYNYIPYSEASIEIPMYVKFRKGLTESLTITDIIIKEGQKNLIETLSLVDSIIKSTTGIHTESIVLTDTITKFSSRIISESLTLTDTIIKTYGKPLLDSLTLTDSITKTGTFYKNLSETINLVDIILKQTLRIFSETLTLTDSIEVYKLFLTILSETITITDYTIEKIGTFYRTFSDTINITDTIPKDLYRIISETLTLNDSITKLTTKSYSETIYLSDIIPKYLAIIKTESLSLTDLITITFLKELIETLTLTDSVITLKLILKTFTEILTLTEQFLKTAITFIKLTESLNLTDVILKTLPPKIFSESISLVDEITKKPMKYFSESLSLIDYAYLRPEIEMIFETVHIKPELMILELPKSASYITEIEKAIIEGGEDIIAKITGGEDAKPLLKKADREGF